MVGLYMLAIWKKAVTDWWQLFSWNKAADEVSCWGWLDFWSKASRIRKVAPSVENSGKLELE